VAHSAGYVARNAANNALANTGHSATSTGSAVSTSKETMVPLSAFSRFVAGNTPIAVYHDNLFAASSISFNLVPGVSLGEATAAVDDRIARLGMPLRSTALSRGRPGHFSNRSHINPC
jgi:multidrug efflux pump